MVLQLGKARALVVGVSPSLGAVITGGFVNEGARFAIGSQTGETLGGRARSKNGEPVIADLSLADGIAQAAREAKQLLGGLDLLIVDFGGPTKGTFAAVPKKQWSVAVDETLSSAMRLMRASVPVPDQDAIAPVLVVLTSSAREPIPGLVTSDVLRPALNGLITTLVPESPNPDQRVGVSEDRD